MKIWKFKKILIIILFLICSSSFVFICQNDSVKETKLDDVKLKEEEKINNNMFAIMLGDKNGVYTELESERWPTDGSYLYNSERSGCIDSNGNEIPNAITFDQEAYLATITTNTTAYCYMYFDLELVPPQEFTFYLGGQTNPDYTKEEEIDVYLEWTDTDIKSYCITPEESTTNCTWTNVSSNPMTIQYTLPTGDGLKTINAYLKDNAGNISEKVIDTINLDKTKPTITNFYLGGSNNPTYATSTTSSIYLKWNDSDVEYYCVTKTNNSETCTWKETNTNEITTTYTLDNSQGEQIRYAFIKDRAGNISDEINDKITLDNNAPTSNSVSINNNATYSTSRTVTLTLSSSGATKMCISESTSCSSYENYAASKSYTFTSDGTKTIYVYYKDAAGNTSAYVSDSIIIDITPPTVSIVAKQKTSGTAITSGKWSTQGLNFTLTQGTVGSSGAKIYYCKDTANTCTPSTQATSGTAITSYNTTTGTYYIRYKIVSNAGLSSSVASYTAKVDTTTPTVTLAAKQKTSGTAITSGNWSTQGLNFTFTNGTVGSSGAKIYYCKDTANTCTPNTQATSGAAITSYNTTEGTYYIRYYIKSNAGLSSSVASYQAKVDTVAPTVSASKSGTNQIAVTVTEATSGVKRYCVNTSSTSTSGCSWTTTTSKSFTTSAVTTSSTYYVHVEDNAGLVGHSGGVAISLGKTGNEFITANKGTGGLGSTAYNGMYYYTGTSVNNYVSIGGVLYRIIGITSQANSTLGLEAGQYKVKKAESIGEYNWYANSKTNIIWTSSAMYTYLNGTVLSNTSIIPSGWSSKIDSVKWYIGDVKGGQIYINKGNLVAGYEDDLITSGNSKIGLIYLSDLYYAQVAGGTTSCYNNNCNNWIIDTSNTMWTMTRWGTENDKYFAWAVSISGSASHGSGLSNAFAVYPVFYLNPDVVITGGTGTSSNPYILS